MRSIKSVRPDIFVGIVYLFSIFAIFAASEVLSADSYPTKPLRLIIPQPPGGGTDIVGRLIAAKLSERLGVQVVAENRAGAGTVLGSEFVAKSSPDGYTLLLANASYAATAAFQKLPYDPVNAFTPIAKIGEAMNVLVVHPSVPAKSVKEFIELAKQKPGQLIFSSDGSGSQVHVSTELFKMMANIDIKIVQFKGGAPAVTDVLGGHSHATIGSAGKNLPHIKAGTFRALCVFGAKRSVMLPDIPTVAEVGLAGCESGTWYGVIAPAGTPTPVIERLNKEIKAITATDEIKKRLLNEGTEEDYLGPTDFAAFMKNELNKWSGVVKKANIKPE
jgi:tripartite-type tricarboxylate transporter receptor subunit TctC